MFSKIPGSRDLTLNSFIQTNAARIKAKTTRQLNIKSDRQFFQLLSTVLGIQSHLDLSHNLSHYVKNPIFSETQILYSSFFL